MKEDFARRYVGSEYAKAWLPVELTPEQMCKCELLEIYIELGAPTNKNYAGLYTVENYKGQTLRLRSPPKNIYWNQDLASGKTIDEIIEIASNIEKYDAFWLTD